MGKKYCKLPDDMLIEILSRLPLKPLARLNCVSKRFKRLIRNTVITMTSRTKLLIMDSGKCIHALNNEACLEKVHPFNYCWESDAVNVPVHSSCYGLVLIGVPAFLVLWNPLTRFIKQYCLKGYYYSLIDLCFDHVNDVYKIIYFSPSCGRDHLAYVSTLWTNRHEVISIPYVVSNMNKGPFVNRFRHYFCKVSLSSDVDIHYNRNRIFYFDPDAMMFFELPIPLPKNNVHDTILGLGVLDGCLCMTRLENPENYEGNIAFVVMKIYANGPFWVTMLVISQVPQLSHRDTLKPLLMTRKGEILVCKSRYVNRYYKNELESVIKVYDLRGKFLREIPAVSSYRRNWYSDVVLYEESWFSPSTYHVTPENSGNYSGLFVEHIDDVWKNYHWEKKKPRMSKYFYSELWELGTMLEDEFFPRKKKMNKKMEKKSRRTKNTTHYSGKKIRRKKHYEPKYANIYFDLTANS